MQVRFLIPLVVSFCLTGYSLVQAKSFRTIPGDVKNSVQFVSKATMEEITGRTVNITGQMDLNMEDVAATQSASFEVDLTTLDTGISLRNQHMRENHLETGQYPKATFVLKKLNGLDKNNLAQGETIKGMAEGDFTIHGVTKAYDIPVTMSYQPASEATRSRLGGNPGNLLFLTAEWKVKLADHEIKRPEFLFLKLAEEQECSIGIALTDAP